MDIRIETSRLILRPFTESDAAAASYNSKQPSVAHYMPEMVKETEEAALGWIRHVNKELFDVGKPCVLFAIVRKADERCMGCIFINRKGEWGNVVEMGYYIADEYQGNGYATEAGKAMIWWAFEKAGQDELSVFAKPENEASRRVIEKLGFIYSDTRLLPHNGEDCAFDCFRLYHIDDITSPEWDDMRSLYRLYRPESMGTFFNTRAGGYNSAVSNNYDYQKFGACFPKTDEAVRILNVGCGTGIELDYIWGQCPNAHITCVDVSRGMLDVLLKTHPDRHDCITIVKASYTDWDYPQKAFDIVTSHAMMHHLFPEEKTGVYRKILGAIKQGGAYIEGGFIVGDALLAEQYRRRHEAITEGLTEKEKASGEYHVDVPLTLDVQIQLLQNAGFASVEVLADETMLQYCRVILEAKK
ncbi:MAG: bifunctional GNAT family N-acetyltransferase/class I SAM-dependent methyltransferase [Oscillospiraceae bacterium]|nr:bifunctional GNAT family N-acetyltransferase/class I SAM-dependent methyltransferase [Oscillospiraceae bacterium]